MLSLSVQTETSGCQPPAQANRYSNLQNLSDKISSFAINFTVPWSSMYVVDRGGARREGYLLKEGQRIAFLFNLAKSDLWSE